METDRASGTAPPILWEQCLEDTVQYRLQARRSEWIGNVSQSRAPGSAAASGACMDAPERGAALPCGPLGPRSTAPTGPSAVCFQLAARRHLEAFAAAAVPVRRPGAVPPADREPIGAQLVGPTRCGSWLRWGARARRRPVRHALSLGLCPSSWRRQGQPVDLVGGELRSSLSRRRRPDHQRCGARTC